MDEKSNTENRNYNENIADSKDTASDNRDPNRDKAVCLLINKYLDDLLSGKVPILPAPQEGAGAAPGEAGKPGGAGGVAAGASAGGAGGQRAPGSAAVTAAGAGSEIERILEKLGSVIAHLSEMRSFLQALCQGNLDAPVPGRRNYIAAPLKELHTQLASLTWSMEQLAKGNIVSKLYYRGTLFESFNSLIEKIAVLSNEESSASPVSAVDPKAAQWEWSVNSWRYHQILSALNNLRIMVFEIARDGKVVYANRPAREYLGDVTRLFDDEAALGPAGAGLSVSGDHAIHADHLASHVGNVGHGAQPGSASRVLEQYLAEVSNDESNFPIFKELYDEESESWYKITSDKIQLSDINVNFLHMVDNISEWKQNEYHLRKTATTDPLTGIYNRGFGIQTLEETLFAAKSGVSSCAAFIDLDNLKVINDIYGHNGGDYALRTIADVLASSVRDNKDIVSRFGGDEFIIIFKNCTKPFAEKAISRMSDKLDEINQSGQVDFDVSFSHGIVEIDGKGDRTLQQVIEHMDQEMYKCKFRKKHPAASGG
ncbi:MAG: diguanylate cyclase, partial [Clostridiales bacterium]|nr:diguanylate cyclase [Clostridiales bacterium]